MTHSPQNGASLMAQLVKNPPADSGEAKDAGLIPGSGSFPGEGNGNPLQHSCLENSMDRGTWWATVHGVHKGLKGDFTKQQQAAACYGVTSRSPSPAIRTYSLSQL